MNKFIRLLLTLGVAAGVVWLLRDKIVPAPQPPLAQPPPFRQPTSPPLAVDEPTPDDITEVKGIGPVYKARLQELGITTFAALASADAAAISEHLEISGNQVDDWISQARDRT
jgi:predicted flap endonuclease-1-like 5' DNA nuclease